MKVEVIVATVFILCHSSLQDDEIRTEPRFDVNQEILKLHERIAKLTEDLTVMGEKNGALQERLAAVNLELKNLQDPPAIAFSAALTHPVGVYNVDITLVYSKVISNVGRAYNPITGIFTAPRNGTYYIRFTSCDNTQSHGMALDLYKNTEKINGLAKYSNGYMTYFSGGLVLQLEAGDVVYTKLPANSKLYDDGNNRTTFSGFLIFLT
ncbi:complement C1q-like protein 3 [Silurus meridionalis]|nr:complement C1q-like protein 3 [Silurus meridionalis]